MTAARLGLNSTCRDALNSRTPVRLRANSPCHTLHSVGPERAVAGEGIFPNARAHHWTARHARLSTSFDPHRRPLAHPGRDRVGVPLQPFALDLVPDESACKRQVHEHCHRDRTEHGGVGQTDEVGESDRPGKRTRLHEYGRESVEFGRALSFFDATFAVALTLLVTTLARANSPWAWDNLHALIAADGSQLGAFALSFAVVSSYWLGSHRFVAGMARISIPLMVGFLIMLAGVVILPFSTEALGQFRKPLSTAVYAVNVAFVSSTEAVLFLLAWSEGLLDPAPERRSALIDLIRQLVIPLVFLASIPLAYLWSPAAAHLSWLSLLVLAPATGAWARRVGRCAKIAGCGDEHAETGTPAECPSCR